MPTDGKVEVASFKDWYNEVNCSGDILFDRLWESKGMVNGVDNLFNIISVSGSKEVGREDSWWMACWSALHPNNGISVSEPKGVSWAWLYWWQLVVYILDAILSGWVMDVHDPFQVLGSGPIGLGWSEELGISMQGLPELTDLDNNEFSL